MSRNPLDLLQWDAALDGDKRNGPRIVRLPAYDALASDGFVQSVWPPDGLAELQLAAVHLIELQLDPHLRKVRNLRDGRPGPGAVPFLKRRRRLPERAAGAEVGQQVHDSVNGRPDHHLREIALGQRKIPDGLVFLLREPVDIRLLRQLA